MMTVDLSVVIVVNGMLVCVSAASGEMLSVYTAQLVESITR